MRFLIMFYAPWVNYKQMNSMAALFRMRHTRELCNKNVFCEETLFFYFYVPKVRKLVNNDTRMFLGYFGYDFLFRPAKN